MSRLAALGFLAAFATFFLFLVLTASRHHHREALAAYVLLMGSLALVSLLHLVQSAAPTAVPSLFERSAARAGAPPLVELEQLRYRLATSQSSAFDFHFRLRPRLFGLAAARLERRYGIDPSRQPERARAVLGEQVWELLRPDREPPRDIREPGLTRRELRLLIEALETV